MRNPGNSPVIHILGVHSRGHFCTICSLFQPSYMSILCEQYILCIGLFPCVLLLKNNFVVDMYKE